MYYSSTYYSSPFSAPYVLKLERVKAPAHSVKMLFSINKRIGHWPIASWESAAECGKEGRAPQLIVEASKHSAHAKQTNKERNKLRGLNP
jgi:hypothetical protein